MGYSLLKKAEPGSSIAYRATQYLVPASLVRPDLRSERFEAGVATLWYKCTPCQYQDALRTVPPYQASVQAEWYKCTPCQYWDTPKMIPPYQASVPRYT
eukprot:489220-Rhodomonas_salina.1